MDNLHYQFEWFCDLVWILDQLRDTPRVCLWGCFLEDLARVAGRPSLRDPDRRKKQCYLGLSTWVPGWSVLLSSWLPSFTPIGRPLFQPSDMHWRPVALQVLSRLFLSHGDHWSTQLCGVSSYHALSPSIAGPPSLYCGNLLCNIYVLYWSCSSVTLSSGLPCGWGMIIVRLNSLPSFWFTSAGSSSSIHRMHYY